jgi:hypothetical protein
MWSAIELNAAIICGSVPALTAFVRSVILGKSTGETSESYPKSGSAGWPGTGGSRRDKDTKAANLSNSARGVTVRESIELTSRAYVPLDDGGSEKDLIENDAFSPALRHQARVNATKPAQDV